VPSPEEGQGGCRGGVLGWPSDPPRRHPRSPLPVLSLSYECLPNGLVATSPHTITIGTSDVTWGPWKEWRSGTSLLFPAGTGKNFTWSAYDGTIAKLRTNPTTLECYYMVVSGTGKDRKLTVLTLGGASYGWTDQCAAASYSALPNVKTAPVCVVAPGSRSPLKSTVIGTYSYAGSAVKGSGAAGTALAAVGLAAAAAFSALLVA